MWMAALSQLLSIFPAPPPLQPFRAGPEVGLIGKISWHSVWTRQSYGASSMTPGGYSPSPLHTKPVYFILCGCAASSVPFESANHCTPLSQHGPNAVAADSAIFPFISSEKVAVETVWPWCEVTGWDGAALFWLVGDCSAPLDQSLCH